MRRCGRTSAASSSAARHAREPPWCSSTCSAIRPSRQPASWACVPRPFGPSPRKGDERSEVRKETGMPDVQEVFRLATNKVKPDPDALERQVRRQRAEVRKSRVRAYVAVAAVLVVLGVAIFTISRAVEKNDKVPDNQGVHDTVQPFLPSLPDG